MEPLRMKKQNASAHAIAVIGNPGTGKSTILNGLVGRAVFKSGISFGTGLTTRLQAHVEDNTTYYDTPGLNDVEKRKEAGAELDQLLREDVSLKIVFVVTVRSGRVSPEDATTITLVLDAITSVDTNNKFGVIINQASKGFVDKMKSDARVEATIRSQVTGSRYTSHWAYVENDSSLVDISDGMLCTAAITRIFMTVPETRPIGAEVTDIDTESYDEKLKREVEIFARKEEALRGELEKQKEVVQEQKEAMRELMVEVKRGKKKMAANEKKAARVQARLEETIEEGSHRIEEAEEMARSMGEEIEKMKRSANRRDRQARLQLEEMHGELERIVNESAERERQIESMAARAIEEAGQRAAHMVATRESSGTNSRERRSRRTPAEDTCYPGQLMRPGDSLTCKTGRFSLVHQDDGNVVIYDREKHGPSSAIWASGTDGRSTSVLGLTNDGNFVLLNRRRVVWSTETGGTNAERAVMQNDGNFCLYNSEGPVFSTGSWQHGWTD